MSESFPPENKEICRYFARGYCNRGRFCQYSHNLDLHYSAFPNQNDGSVREPRKNRSVRGRTAANSDLPANHDDGAALNLCKHFFATGWCKFGKSCRFSHIQPLEVKSDLQFDQRETRQSVQASVKETRAEDEKVREETRYEFASSAKSQKVERRVCRYFQSGHCRQGSNCKFVHQKKGYKEERNGGKTCENVKSEDDREVDQNLSSVQKNDAVRRSSERNVPSRSGSNQPFYINSKPHQQAQPQFACAVDARKKELELARKRFPTAGETEGPDGSTTMNFVFSPSDPDWPYDITSIDMEVQFPKNYPNEMMHITVREMERMPETVRRLISESVEDWVMERHQSTKKGSGAFDLAFRPLLRWLDKNCEEIFTDALRQYKREKVAEAAGLQFIPAVRLRQRVFGSAAAVQEKREEDLANCDQDKGGKDTRVYVKREETGSELDNGEEGRNSGLKGVTRNVDYAKGRINSEQGEFQERDHIDTSREDVEFTNSYGKADSETTNDSSISAATDKPNDHYETSTSNRVTPLRRGTEATLLNLQLGEGVATIQAKHVALTIACSRCNRTCEIATPCERTNSASCAYCHSRMMLRFNTCIVHQMSNVVGYLDMEGCRAVDMNLANSAFAVGCLNCDKEMKFESLAPGQLNSSWCNNCHQKLALSVNSVRFLHVASSVQLDSSAVCNLELKKPVKAVKDPLIQLGKPLPENGTCKHYKKSYRWLRFPCCGKAYPCDVCHEENESHEMKLANRMICGHCSKEQPYSAEGTCIGCKASMTNRSTSHWEGGLGCRDKIKMSRNDSKKFANSSKTISCSVESKRDASKKVTKLRHAV